MLFPADRPACGRQSKFGQAGALVPIVLDHPHEHALPFRMRSIGRGGSPLCPRPRFENVGYMQEGRRAPA